MSAVQAGDRVTTESPLGAPFVDAGTVKHRVHAPFSAAPMYAVDFGDEPVTRSEEYLTVHAWTFRADLAETWCPECQTISDYCAWMTGQEVTA